MAKKISANEEIRLCEIAAKAYVGNKTWNLMAEVRLAYIGYMIPVIRALRRAERRGRK